MDDLRQYAADMKAKCPKCGTGKPRRLCHRTENHMICSECCASMRDESCGDCPHYSSARAYEEKRIAAKNTAGSRPLLIDVSSHVVDEVNAQLALAESGNLAAAHAGLLRMLRQHPRHDGIPFGIGVIHFMNSEYEEAVRWFQRALDINPYNTDALFNQATAYQNLLDFSNCIRCFQQVVGIGPADKPEVMRAQSILDSLAADIRKTEGVGMSEYLDAMRLFDEGFDLMREGKWSAALEKLRASAAISERNAPCHGNIGLCLAYLGRKAEALAALDRALEINPEYTPAKQNRRTLKRMTEGQPLENIRSEEVDFGRHGIQ